MLSLIDAHAELFTSWQVTLYEQEGDTYALQVSAVLRDGSRLDMRDYLFADGTRKYAYHWMDAAGRLRRRWDNAPHWPDVSTAPHHMHIPEEDAPAPSTITDIDSLLEFIEDWLRRAR